MMKIILAHNYYDKKQLVEVMTKMERMGQPTIRAYYIGNDTYQAIEGCHRLRAAAALGITPEIDDIESDTLRSDVDGLDWYDGQDPATQTVASIGDYDNKYMVFED